MKIRRVLVSFMVLLTIVFIAIGLDEEVEIIHDDLKRIKEDGELVVLTINSYESYFNYGEVPMGFQYELAQGFAKSLGVELKVKLLNSEEELVNALLNGEGDLIAYNLAITNNRKKELIFCGKENITRQVLVQRNGKRALNDVTQLVGKEVYVIPGKYGERIENLNNELGGGIIIKKVSQDSITNEDLIEMVVKGEIDYTVTNNDLAKINRTYYSNINTSLEISLDQRSAWAVRKSSFKLAEEADKWHKENINSTEFEVCARKYFELNKHSSQGSMLSLKDGISYYDDLLRKYASKINWDWRLLAALVFTESNFNPSAVSRTGAKGLMQLTPSTARTFGVPDGMECDPEQSIKGGVSYIADLQKIFSKVTDENERIMFVLASYNSGIGHVFDAMALAEKYGKDKYVWNGNVAVYILKKDMEEYYKDPVCKNGYLRGTETCNFVRDVLARADMYIKNTKE